MKTFKNTQKNTMYHYNDLNFSLIQGKPINLINDMETHRLFWFFTPTDKVYINYNKVNITGNSLVFSTPDDIIISEGKINKVAQLTIRKSNKKDPIRLVSLLFNNRMNVYGDINSSQIITFDNNNVESYFTSLKILFEHQNINQEQKQTISTLINQIILECVCLKILDYNKEIELFTTLVNQQYKQQHQVTDYAKQMVIPPKKLLEIFNRKGYAKPSSIIKSKLLKEAKHLLASTNRNINQIGYEIGIEDPAYFSRFFKKNTGVTALEFRNYFQKYINNEKSPIL
ncbi:Transcriptional regulator, AraC family [Tenacibaculum maritimum]|uniref:helix-turn-helix domain-containing protein n=1 Tax=Tenacibaculum maritimum TaxID=107401 RepID=UPI0012E58AD5|nr:helix-turn-helix domain-containing protein [Tenacibaculum maritimum]CAA0181266.1 Transcriptional regulator, AraC family [Tenacibaculum maritimum]